MDATAPSLTIHGASDDDGSDGEGGSDEGEEYYTGSESYPWLPEYSGGGVAVAQQP